MRSTLKENPSLAFLAAQAELADTKTQISRKQFTPEVDDLILDYWGTIPITELMSILNTHFEKDYYETQLRRRYKDLVKTYKKEQIEGVNCD